MRRLETRFPLALLALSLIWIPGNVTTAQTWTGPASLGVSVKNSKGQALAQALIKIAYRDIGYGDGPPARRTTEKGEVNFVGLAEGTWSIKIDHVDHLSYLATLVIRRGKKPQVLSEFLEATGTGRQTMRVKQLKPTPENLGTPVEALRQADIATPPAAAVPPTKKPVLEAAASPTSSTEVTVPETTVPEVIPEVTAPEVTVPEVTPEVTAPEVTIPEVTPEVTTPADSLPEPLDEPAVEAVAEPSAEPVAGEAAAVEIEALPEAMTEPAAEMATVAAQETLSEPSPDATPEMPLVDAAHEQAAAAPEPLVADDLPESAGADVEPEELDSQADAPDELIAAPAPEPEPETAAPALTETPTPAGPELAASGAKTEAEPQGPQTVTGAEIPVGPEATPETASAPEAVAAVSDAMPSEPAAFPGASPAPVEQEGRRDPAPLGPQLAPDPQALQSYRDRSCRECRPGEWSVVSTALVRPQPESDCALGESELRSGLQKLMDSFGSHLAEYAGPLPFERLPLSPELERQFTSCGLLAVVIPNGARYAGFRLQASDPSGDGDCVAGRSCSIGEASWLFTPIAVQGDGASLVFSLFRNESAYQDRSATLSAYFVPPSGWLAAD